MEETVAYLVFIVVISSGVVLFLAFITVDIFMLLRYRQLKMQTEMFEIKSNFTKELSLAREEAAADVMNEIARELHDNILQQLTLTTLQLNQTGNAYPQAIKAIQPTIDLIRETSTELRELSHMLSGDLYNNLDLENTVLRLKESLERTGIIEANFETNFMLDKLDKSKELFILRILQEMVNNSMKHASATILTFELTPKENFVRFYYHDNGRGFNRHKVSPGFGLIGIEKRLDLMKATWSIDTQEGNGFNFNAEIPYKENDKN